MMLTDDLRGVCNAPKRIQRKRTKGWRLPPDTIIVDRSTMYGNPWRPGTPGTFVGWSIADFLMGGPLTAADAVVLYTRWLDGDDMSDALPPILNASGRYEALHVLKLKREAILRMLDHLRGYNLACWCDEDEPCHVDPLLVRANSPAVRPTPCGGT